MIKKILLLLFSILIILHGLTQTNGTCGAEGNNLLWEFDPDTETLTISGTGEMADYTSSLTPWYDYRVQITQIEDGVTSIGSYAFFNCNSLVFISVPNSITTIGTGAFSGCTALISIEVENTNPFYSSENGVLFNREKTNLIRYPAGKSGGYIIPDNVTSIARSAFSDCTTLTSLIISNSVTNIEGAAFYGCSALTSVIIGNNVASIEEYAFSGCTNLASIITPNSIMSVGEYAFNNTLWYDNQPDGCVYIGKALYKYKGSMPAFTTIEIQGGTVSITGSAFYDYTNLASVIIPGSVTSIGNYAFYGCVGLISIFCCAVHPPMVGALAFFEVEKSICTLYVPVGSLLYYSHIAAIGWRDFFFVEENFFFISTEVPEAAGMATVYPNPATESFYITGIEENTPIILSDVSGKVVLHIVVAPKEAVSVAHLPQGLYIFQVDGMMVKLLKK